jgi:uncharacterized protein DUF1573
MRIDPFVIGDQNAPHRSDHSFHNFHIAYVPEIIDGETMKPKAIFLAIFFVIVVCSLLVFFGKTNIPGNPLKPVSDIPIPAEHGPYPKAIAVDGTLYDFGTMEQGQKGEHVFKLRNEGEAPLKISPGKSSCQCTIGSLGKNGLEPGEGTTLTISWDIRNPVPRFEQFAKFHTNDPLNPELSFNIRGSVGRKLVFKPSAEIALGLLPEGKPTERLLTLHSEILESFDIKQIETSTPLIVVETRPLKSDELSILSQSPSHEDLPRPNELELPAAKMLAGKTPEQIKAEHLEPRVEQLKKKEAEAKKRQDDELANKPPAAKCGYELKVVFRSGLPIGRFRETITIHTNLDSAETLTASFQGTRSGPVEIFATPGVAWSSEEGALRFKRFRAADGTKAKLMLFVNKFDHEFAVTEAKMDPPTVQYQLVRDMNFKGTGRDKFDLLLEVPPGETPITLGGQNPGQILLHTNHPDASIIKMNLEYTSF